MQTSLSQLKIGLAALECQVEQHTKKSSGDLRTIVTRKVSSVESREREPIFCSKSSCTYTKRENM